MMFLFETLAADRPRKFIEQHRVHSCGVHPVD
jgi:hypothetical protein